MINAIIRFKKSKTSPRNAVKNKKPVKSKVNGFFIERTNVVHGYFVGEITSKGMFKCAMSWAEFQF